VQDALDPGVVEDRDWLRAGLEVEEGRGPLPLARCHVAPPVG
jgi:hypothetical protein